MAPSNAERCSTSTPKARRKNAGRKAVRPEAPRPRAAARPEHAPGFIPRGAARAAWSRQFLQEPGPSGCPHPPHGPAGARSALPLFGVEKGESSFFTSPEPHVGHGAFSSWRLTSSS